MMAHVNGAKNASASAPRPRADDPRFLGSEQDLAPLDRDPVVAFGVV